MDAEFACHGGHSPEKLPAFCHDAERTNLLISTGETNDQIKDRPPDNRTFRFLSNKTKH